MTLTVVLLRRGHNRTLFRGSRRRLASVMFFIDVILHSYTELCNPEL